jgi:hypothetical protein
VLERLDVPLPERIEVSRDGGPQVPRCLELKYWKKVLRKGRG